jgi:hypothetical protein
MKGLGCVKAVYAEHDAIEAVKDAKRTNPEYGWFHVFCRECAGYHICRLRKAAA